MHKHKQHAFLMFWNWIWIATSHTLLGTRATGERSGILVWRRESCPEARQCFRAHYLARQLIPVHYGLLVFVKGYPRLD